MNYEKKYKDALEWARKVMQGKIGFVLDEVLEKFPELKVSEDEKIRKEIIALLKDRYGRYPNDPKYSNAPQWIAWLEKQGEQKPAVIIPKFRIGDYVKNVNDKRNPIYEIVYMDKECYVCEYRGKENIGDKAVMHFAFDYPYLRQIHKTAWSEEDEEIYRKCICAMRASACGFPEEEKFVEQVDNWLKSLKERVQPKQEWSEEDEKILSDIITSITNLKDSATSDALRDIYNSKIDWLKSLRPQNTWKPSEEQMDTLEYYMCTLICNHYKEILFSLYQDLKKLREE